MKTYINIFLSQVRYLYCRKFNLLEDILQKFPQIILLSDEVYEYITFEKKHISTHSRIKPCNHRVVVSSVGKSFHVAGWKVGYLEHQTI